MNPIDWFRQLNQTDQWQWIVIGILSALVIGKRR